MAEHEWSSNLIYEERVYLAGQELSSFIAAVTELQVRNKPSFPKKTGVTRNWS